MAKLIKKRKVSFLLFSLSLIFLFFGIYFIWQAVSPVSLAFDIKSLSNSSDNYIPSVYPKYIIMKDINVYVPVYPAVIKNGHWEASTVGANFLVDSALPGNRGNSIIYAHNFRNLFGNLPSIHKNQLIDIIFSDGTDKTFTVATVQIVSPDDVGILSQTADSRLTLYTCTGFLDSQRFVVTALPV